jgi:hypothetical protein
MKSLIYISKIISKGFYIIVIIIFLSQLIELTSGKKLLYSDLLTNDNELIILEQIKPNKANSKKTPILTQNLNNNNNKNINNINESSKLIVNVIYLNNDKSEIKAQPLFSTSTSLTSSYSSSQSSSSNSPSSASKLFNQAERQKKIIVYYTSDDKTSPCDKNLCKSDEVCLSVNSSNSSKSYECISKDKIAHKRAKRVSSKQNSAIITNRTKDIEDSGTKCKLNSFFDTSLAIYEQFKSHGSFKIGEYCSTEIESNFNSFDFNKDAKLSYEEFSEKVKSKLDDSACLIDYFSKCDTNKDTFLSKQETCDCINDLKPKCSLIRLNTNHDLKKIYINELNTKLFKLGSQKNDKTSSTLDFNLALNSYVPICDIEGYFHATQCDKRVTCWCVNKYGKPIYNSITQIDQNPIDCKNFL